MLYRGNLIWKGHRAYGSLFYHLLLAIVFIGSSGYLADHRIYNINLSQFNLPYHLSLLGHSYVLTGIGAFLVVLYLIVKKYQWTYIITDREMIVRFGIIARNEQSYLYNEVQEAHPEQTLTQRLLLWGNIRFTLLQSGTGQATPEEVMMPYVSSPAHVSDFVIQNVKKIGMG